MFGSLCGIHQSIDSFHRKKKKIVSLKFIHLIFIGWPFFASAIIWNIDRPFPKIRKKKWFFVLSSLSSLSHFWQSVFFFVGIFMSLKAIPPSKQWNDRRKKNHFFTQWTKYMYTHFVGYASFRIFFLMKSFYIYNIFPYIIFSIKGLAFNEIYSLSLTVKWQLALKCIIL